MSIVYTGSIVLLLVYLKTCWHENKYTYSQLQKLPQTTCMFVKIYLHQTTDNIALAVHSKVKN